jgi:uncharacterized protein YcbK (DUF882 family)
MAGRRRRWVMVAVGVAALFGVADTSDPRRRFFEWRDAHRADVDAYATYLRGHGVDGVVPLPQLLRTVRDWRRCGDEFAVPPRATWPAIVPTLQLLAELRSDGVLAGRTQVMSTWRSPAMNACAGGAGRSRHVDNGALDLDWDAPPDGLARLCEAWGGELGSRRAWGLGFYTPTRIHLDTSGWRTWGHDFHSRTSLCVARAE